MKVLCITGADNSTLESIANAFSSAGMQLAKGIEREKTITFSSWHKRVGDRIAQGKPIGKLWETLADDLLLANIDSEYWGWYDENSIKALSYWAEREPNISFLLVCTRPDEAVRKHVESDEQIDIEACLSDWYNHHKKLLEFYHSHSDICYLIDCSSAKQHLNQQLRLVYEDGDAPFTSLENLEDSDEQTQLIEQNDLLSFLTREVIKRSDVKIVDLFEELIAAQYQLGHSLDNSQMFKWLREEPNVSNLNMMLTECHSSLKASIRMEGALKQAGLNYQMLQLELEQAVEDKDAIELELDKKQNENILVKESLEQVIAKKNELENELETLNVKLTNNVKELEQENELLLLQLHQVQEEFESLVEEKNTLNKELKSVNDQSSCSANELEQENELLLLQLHQVQEELEHYFIEFQNLSKEQALLKNEAVVLKRKLKRQQSKNMLGHNDKTYLEYDRAYLERNQVNPDYEHLSIRLTNPSFADIQAEEWTFRVSCAAVTPQSFGLYPKLEFPQQSEQLLENWFVEGVDDFGEKMELRFALPSVMDLAVWNQFSASDQGLIVALLKQLPSILEELKEEQVNLSRNWQDWLTLVENMNKICAPSKHLAKA